ncbi:MAG: hypothetical protein ACJ8IK_26870 [Burkholderiaceae bacterium]
MAIRSPVRHRPALLSRLGRLMRLMRSHVRVRPSGTPRDPVEPAGATPPPPAPEPALSAGWLEQRVLGVELTRTLDRHEMSRAVMPALALLERALSAPTGRGEARLAAPVLWDAINHINMLSDTWQGNGLPALRRRLSAALGLDEADVDVLCASNQPCHVAEARLSDFMQVMDEWTQLSDSGQGRLAGPLAH